MRSDWTREALDKSYEKVRDYVFAQSPINFDVEEALIKLYVEATIQHTRTEDYYELAEAFRRRIMDVERLRA